MLSALLENCRQEHFPEQLQAMVISVATVDAPAHLEEETLESTQAKTSQPIPGYLDSSADSSATSSLLLWPFYALALACAVKPDNAPGYMARFG